MYTWIIRIKYIIIAILLIGIFMIGNYYSIVKYKNKEPDFRKNYRIIKHIEKNDYVIQRYYKEHNEWVGLYTFINEKDKQTIIHELEKYIRGEIELWDMNHLKYNWKEIKLGVK